MPRLPNNAGVGLLKGPLSPICGKNDIKVNILNNGFNKLDSVRVNWSLNGVLQKPVFVTKAIDTSRTAFRREVTLDSAKHLSTGKNILKVWTSHPNGKADTLNLDDTLETILLVEIEDASIVPVKPFKGITGQGTAAWPDTMCVYDTIFYNITPPKGYTNADFGSEWSLKYLDFKAMA